MEIVFPFRCFYVFNYNLECDEEEQMRKVNVCINIILIFLNRELFETPEKAPQDHKQEYVLPKQPPHPIICIENVSGVVTYHEDPA